jgi:Fic family protein
MPQYLWENLNWPNFSWNSEMALKPLAFARKRQGHFLREMEGLGFQDGLRAYAFTVEEDAIQTAAIEGERLDREGVRSSVALRLGLPEAGLRPADRTVDGLVEVLLDAAHNHAQPLTKERLCGWHSTLFPSGRSGLNDIITGAWRNAPMQVVSGPYARRRIHFIAPPPERIETEMAVFFSWWNDSREKIDGIIRAALAHLHFVTIHPFDDGNGRLARTITDMALAQDEGMGRRCYSLSAQIMQERNTYYDILEKTPLGGGDCTEWLLWFINCFDRALETATAALQAILFKAAFWKRYAETEVNGRQRKALNRLLDAGKDGFEGGLSTRKYVGMTRVSRATAWREIEDMLQKGMIRALPGGGRSKAYEIVSFSGQEKSIFQRQ